jgi:hypothetical protein
MRELGDGRVKLGIELLNGRQALAFNGLDILPSVGNHRQPEELGSGHVEHVANFSKIIILKRVAAELVVMEPGTGLTTVDS